MSSIQMSSNLVSSILMSSIPLAGGGGPNFKINLFFKRQPLSGLTTIYPFFPGTRAIPRCLETERYYESIDTCVNESIYTNPQFITALTSQKVCSGGMIADYLALEALRDCEVITSSLIIAVSDVDADYSALFLIREIQGIFVCLFCR
jgi:hypothetical protein